MFKDKLNFKLLNLLILLIIIYIGIATIDFWMVIITKVISILLPFIISFGIAYSLYPLIRKLQEKGIRKSFAVTLVVILMSCFIFGLIVITVPIVYEQLITLTRLTANVIGNFSYRFSIDLGEFETSLIEILNSIIIKIGNYVSVGTVELANKLINFFTKFIIIYVVSIYFLAGMENIRDNTKLFLKNKKQKLFYYVKAIDKDLEQYLHGLLIFIIIQLFEYCFLFWIIGHPNWLLLGLLASVTTVIPYIGGLVTNIIAVILSTVVSTPLFIATLVVCLVAPSIDSYIISPKVYGKTNNISPLWTIFAIFVGGALFKFIGILIALPMYIIIKRTFIFFKNDVKTRFDDIKSFKTTK